MRPLSLIIGGIAASGLAAAVSAAPQAVVTLQAAPAGAGTVDYARAKPMAMPMSRVAPSKPMAAATMAFKVQRPGAPGVVAGKAGTGLQSPVTLFTGRPDHGIQAAAVEPQQFGLSSQPFTTSRANIESMKLGKAYPFTAVGKLYFNIGRFTYVCSASLIQPGVVVTAAHCVSQFGANTYYTNFRFIPAYSQGLAPFGTWRAELVGAPTNYLNGTTPCADFAPGVVCQDDVAVIVLAPKSGRYPGEATGFLGYAWNGTGFNADNLALLTQLGYPVASDLGEVMQRTDSQAFVDPESVNNTILGSEMQGGSSGGPWVTDWGIAANGYLLPQPTHNVVVGVTSWGYVDPLVKQQGASPFLSTNIVPLVNAACNRVPAACATN